jgi:NADH-quinone oxidoreductase subunit A
MVRSYLPALVILGLSVAQAVGMVILSTILSPGGRTKVKSAPYESGMDPLGGTNERFSVKFYVVAILFIVFDVETIFLLPWAVSLRPLGWGGFASAMIFIFILTVGLVYEWKKGALEWD